MRLVFPGQQHVALRALGAADTRFAGFVNGVNDREMMAADVRASANRRAIGVRDMVIVKDAVDVDRRKTRQRRPPALPPPHVAPAGPHSSCRHRAHTTQGSAGA